MSNNTKDISLGQKKSRSRRKLSNINKGLSHPRHGFFLGTEWINLRSAVLKIYKRTCARCQTSKGVMQVDHILPRSKYPEKELDFFNLQVLCISCNKLKGSVDFTDHRLPGTIPDVLPEMTSLTEDQLYHYRIHYLRLAGQDIGNRRSFKSKKHKDNKAPRGIKGPVVVYNEPGLTVPKGRFISSIVCRVLNCSSRPIEKTPYCPSHTYSVGKTV